MKKLFLSIVVSSFFLSGCNLFGGAPWYAFESWRKEGVSVQQTKQVLIDCKYPDGDADVSNNEIALAQICMLKKGFSHHDPYLLFCNQQKIVGKLPACEGNEALIPKP